MDRLWFFAIGGEFQASCVYIGQIPSDYSEPDGYSGFGTWRLGERAVGKRRPVALVGMDPRVLPVRHEFR